MIAMGSEMTRAGLAVGDALAGLNQQASPARR